MSVILEAILKTLPSGWQLAQLHIGANWTVSVVENEAGEQRAGLAATPAPHMLNALTNFASLPDELRGVAAHEVAHHANRVEPLMAAVGLATLNALLRPDPAQLADIDAGDWLLENGAGKKIALVGRFPLKDELAPVAAHLWVLELVPQPGEYASSEAATILPQAELVAITGSTLVNHTLDGLLELVRPGTLVMLLGPTTPLTPVLFDFGVMLLSGVQVVDLPSLLASVAQGVSFRQMTGLRRVTLQRSLT